MSYYIDTTIVIPTNNKYLNDMVADAQAQFREAKFDSDLDILTDRRLETPEWVLNDLAKQISGEDDYGVFKVEERNGYNIYTVETNRTPKEYEALLDDLIAHIDEFDEQDEADIAIVRIGECGETELEYGNYNLASVPHPQAIIRV